VFNWKTNYGLNPSGENYIGGVGNMDLRCAPAPRRPPLRSGPVPAGARATEGVGNIGGGVF
jgi:hypothetical protein